ncbi:MAG: Gldg family protein [Leptospiraceae bacterium]|nr:Gldg family protein [Leptospiraceae bacterium]MCP5510677.1 Gldg family protein [Leptospiraceae bacterium]
MRNLSPNTVIPFFSIISLYFYFLSYDFFLNPVMKNFRDFFFLLFCFSDLGFRLYQKQKNESPGPTAFTISILTASSFLFYSLRIYLDMPAKPGISTELSMIPKVRDFLLVLVILTSLITLVFQLLILITKQSEVAQTNLGRAKRSLLQNTLISLFSLAPLLIAVNYFSSKKNYNFDLSAIGKFSYSETSRSIIKSLDRDVSVTAFYPRPLEASGKEESWALSALRPEIEIYLEQLKAINPRISVKFINADVERELITDFQQVSNGMIVFRSLKTGADLGGNPYIEEKVFVQNKKDLEELERKIVQAINNVALPPKNIYFSSNYGEHYGNNYINQPTEKIDKFISTLNFFNFRIHELNYKSGFPDSIPEDADMIAFIGPSIEIPEIGRENIRKFVMEKKGKVFITIDPKSRENFNWLLDKSKLEFRDANLRQSPGRPEIIAANFPDHPITRLFIKKEVGVVLTNTGYFEKRTDRINPEYDEFLIMDSGFNTYIDSNKNEKMDADEFLKNYSLAAVLSPVKKQENENPANLESEGRFLIFASTDWVTDKMYLFNLNPVMAGNSINWMFQKPILDKILPKKEEIPVISLTQNQKLMIWSMGLFGYPLLWVAGLSIFVLSKKRKTK